MTEPLLPFELVVLRIMLWSAIVGMSLIIAVALFAMVNLILEERRKERANEFTSSAD